MVIGLSGGATFTVGEQAAMENEDRTKKSRMIRMFFSLRNQWEMGARNKTEGYNLRGKFTYAF
jgi:hypothetical protein